jgi:hypothetical protein
VKRSLPMAIAIGIGVLVLLDRFVANSYLDALGFFFLDTAIILGAFAILLGCLNVLTVHVQKVRTRQSGWFYSIILILFALFVLLIGSTGPSTPLLQRVFNTIQYPIQATIASLLIFFVASAAFRALRLRSGESVILVGVTVVVLIGQVPLSGELTAVKDWIFAVPALAGVRGLILGVALGTVVTGLRVLMGVDRPYSK